MTDRRRLLLTRRQLLKAGGLTAIAAGAASLGPRLVGTIVQPGPRPRVPTSRRTSSSSARTAGSPCRRRPRSSRARSASPRTRTRTRPEGLTTYIFGFANASGLADDVQFNLKNKAQHSAPLFWAREGEDFRVQLTNVGLAQRPGPVRRAHRPLARLQERHPVLRRRADGLGLDPAGPDVHLRLHLARPRHLHVPLPRGGHGARADGDDRPRVRPAGPGRQHVALPEREVRLQRRRRLDRLRPRVRDVPDRGVGRLPLGGRPHPAARSGATTGRTSASSTAGSTRTRSCPTARSRGRATTQRPGPQLQRVPGTGRQLGPGVPGGSPRPRRPAELRARLRATPASGSCSASRTSGSWRRR